MKTIFLSISFALAFAAGAQEFINLGSSANDGNGDKLRAAGVKINTNFHGVFQRVGVLESTVPTKLNTNGGTAFDLTLRPTSADDVPLTIRGATGQDSSLLEVRDALGVLMFGVNYDGSLFGDGLSVRLTASSTPGHVWTATDADGHGSWQPPTGGGSGEANTASNVGIGVGLFKGKSGVDLQFKTAKGTNGITVSTNLNELLVDGANLQPLDSDLTAWANYSTNVIASVAQAIANISSNFLHTLKQNADSDLDGVAGLTGTGIAVRTGTGTWTTRMISPGTGLQMVNGDGVSGNPTVTLGTDLLDLASDGVLSGARVGSGVDASVITAGTLSLSRLNISTTQRLLGRNSAGSGAPEEVSLSQFLDWIGSAAQGDILYRGASTWTRLPAGTSGQYLQTLGAGANPAWATVSGGVADGDKGDVTVSSGVWSLDNGVVTDAKIAGSGITTRSKLPAEIAYQDANAFFTGNLTVNGKGTNNDDLVVRDRLDVIGTNSNPGITVRGYSNTVPSLLLEKYNGTEAAPTAMLAGQDGPNIQLLARGPTFLRFMAGFYTETLADFVGVNGSSRLRLTIGNNASGAGKTMTIWEPHAISNYANAHFESNVTVLGSIASGNPAGTKGSVFTKATNGNAGVIHTVRDNSTTTNTLVNDYGVFTPGQILLVQAVNGQEVTLTNATLAGGWKTGVTAANGTITINETNASTLIASNATTVQVDFSTGTPDYRSTDVMRANLTVYPTNLVAGRTATMYLTGDTNANDRTVTVVTNGIAGGLQIRWFFNTPTNGATSFTTTNNQRSELSLKVISPTELWAAWSPVR